jgi:hypothetical protein
MIDSVTACEYARERHKNIARWRNLWTILLFVFGSAVVLFLTIAVLLFLRQATLGAALSTLGTIVGGVAIKWVVDRRVDAVKEEQDAYSDVAEKCGNASMADAFRSRNTLVGKFW